MITEYCIVILQFSFCDTVFELEFWIINFRIIEQFSVIVFIYLIYHTTSIDRFVVSKYDMRMYFSGRKEGSVATKVLIHSYMIVGIFCMFS